MKLSEWIKNTAGANAGEYEDVIEKHGHLDVMKEVPSSEHPFPQKHFLYRNVRHWVLLGDGSAVGFNESPRNGWNFVRLGKKTVKEIYKG